MRIGIVGAGVAGAFTAWTLAKHGHSVTVFEQHDIGHDRGSSHGASRIVRKTYPDRLHTRLMDEAYPLWDQAQSEAGCEWLVRTGILYLGPANHPEMMAVADALDAVRIAWENVVPSGDDHGLRWHPGETGILQREGGFLRAGAAVEGAIAQAVRAGAEVLSGTRVDELTIDGAGVSCKTLRGDRTFDRMVVCAGAWTSRLLPGLADRLVPTRQVWGYASHSDASSGSAPEMVWIDALSHWYGFPPETGSSLAKIAHHHPGERVDPNLVERIVGEADTARIADASAARLGRLGPIVDPGTCLYTNTPDGCFILDHALGGRVTVVSACSGHGFKFGPLIGHLAADACVSGAWRNDLTVFRADRFGPFHS